MRAAQSVRSEDFERSRDQPVDERRFFEIGNSIQAGGHPVAGREHVARDLRLHRVHVVHQRWRRNHAARVDRGGDQQNDQVEVKTFSIVRARRAAPALWSGFAIFSSKRTVSSIPTDDSRGWRAGRDGPAHELRFLGAERTRHVRRTRMPRLPRATAGAVRGTSRAWECRNRFSFY